MTFCCHLSAVYKIKQHTFHPQWSHARGHSTEDDVTWPLWLPWVTCPEPQLPLYTHTAPPLQLPPPYALALSVAAFNAWLMSASPSRMRILGEEEEEWVFHCTHKPSTEKGQKPLLFKFQMFLPSSVPGHQHILCFSLLYLTPSPKLLCKVFIPVVPSKSLCLFPPFSVSSFLSFFFFFYYS